VQDRRDALSVGEARAELDQLAGLDGEVEVSLRWTITTKTHDG
jgi:hypothetical protein